MNKIKAMINRIEGAISVKGKILIGTILASTILGLALAAKPSERNITDATVKLTNGRGGGSGVIIAASNSESTVLTNRHVCEILKRGGYVESVEGTYMVASIKQSFSHDLCTVKVNANLKHASKVASNAPKIFDSATVSGHPNLYPNVVTKGHVSGRQFITVMTGVKACTKEDIESEQGLLCLFFGGIPQLERFEAQLVTATIMAGSSGSAVYNEDREIIGMVFAGNGDLSYAFVVPYEYIVSFLKFEVDLVRPEIPNNKLNFFDLIKEQNRSISKKCQEAKHPKIIEYCKLVEAAYEFKLQN